MGKEPKIDQQRERPVPAGTTTASQQPQRTRRVLNEAAHKLPEASDAAPPEAEVPARTRRVLNEAAHKLEVPAPARLRAGEQRGARQEPGATATGARGIPAASEGGITATAGVPQEELLEEEAEAPATVRSRAGLAMLALGALGVVYGDLGTSPLYTEQVTFSSSRVVSHATPSEVYGVVSLIFWSLILEPSIKYALIVMRADNHGEGGIMALAAIIQRIRRHQRLLGAALLITLGIFGAGLFLGDGMITPTITVLSAIEGLSSVSTGFTHLEVPIGLGILVGLFMLQRLGTHAVGWLFGPVMLIFFATIAVLGAHELLRAPGVLQGLSPTYAVSYLFGHGADGFLLLAFVVLTITGCEAMFADLGHFGKRAINLAWFCVVLPGVLLNYLGQAALIRLHRSAIANPFYLLVPHALRLPMVFLSTAAAIIASQAVISGSFSLVSQAVSLGWLPRVRIVHTSKKGIVGQIYVPAVNWFLCLAVVLLVLGFQHSTRLANAYGMAVTGVLLLNTTLFIAVARATWRTSIPKLAAVAAIFGTLEAAFVAANATKILHGAWVPLVVGLGAALIMLTWRKGAEIVTQRRIEREGSLQDFLEDLRTMEPPVRRAPGTAIFLHPGRETAPLALRAAVRYNRALASRVLIVRVDTRRIPYVRDESKRFVVEEIAARPWQVAHLTVRFGYREPHDVPAALRRARARGILDPDFDIEGGTYVISKITVTPTRERDMNLLAKRLFVVMTRNAASPIDHFSLPVDRTLLVGSRIEI